MAEALQCNPTVPVITIEASYRIWGDKSIIYGPINQNAVVINVVMTLGNCIKVIYPIIISMGNCNTKSLINNPINIFIEFCINKHFTKNE